MAGLTRYDNSDKVIDTQKIVTSTWSDNTNDASAFMALPGGPTSSIAVASDATSSNAFFIELYNTASSHTTKETQYAIAYGHKKGSGSKDFTNDEGSFGNSPSKVIYNQYRQLVYGDETSDFNFDGVTPDDIYVINVNRARYKHNLKPGTLNLKLSGSDVGSAVGFIKLTDDSVSATGSAVITNAGRQFNLVSGSSGVRLGDTLTQVIDSTIKASGSYGFFYPDAGFIILNPMALSSSIHLSSSANANEPQSSNIIRFKNAISGGAEFIVDSEEKVTSQYFFTRAKNNEYNYTTNPSFIDTNGNLNYTSMVDNPKTFITTVGLYSDSNELLGVAKLSQPVAKDFTKEALIRVKLDY